MKSIEFAEKQLNRKMIATTHSGLQTNRLAVEALNTKIDSNIINCIIKNKEDQQNCYNQQQLTDQSNQEQNPIGNENELTEQQKK